MTSEIDIEKIADRAIELSALMSHGHACFAACREQIMPESDVANTASVVSSIVTQREINPRRQTPDEAAKEAAIEALIPKHLEAIAVELEIESAKRGGNWGQKAIAAIRRGQPRMEHAFSARQRASQEISRP